MNAHSLRLHLYDIRSEMLKHKLHVLGICESHVEPSIASSLVEIPGYKFFRNDRNSSRAKGGVAVYVHESIAAKVLFRSVQPAKYINVPEIILIELHFDRFKILCGTVYSPPKAGQLSDVEEALSLCTGSYDLTLLMGDFNIEWHSNCSPRRILYEFLDNFELERLVFGTTHHQEFSDTTIDYICVSDLTKVISFDQKHVPHISKHDFLCTSLAFTVPPTASSTITRRCYKNVCMDRLLQDLEMADWVNFDRLQDVESKVEFLTSTLTAVYDAHAPHRTLTTERKSMPWITVPIQRLISLRNKAWRNFKRNGNIESRNNYKGLRNHVQQVLRNAKHNFFRQKLSSSRNSTELGKWSTRLVLARNIDAYRRVLLKKFSDEVE